METTPSSWIISWICCWNSVLLQNQRKLIFKTKPKKKKQNQTTRAIIPMTNNNNHNHNHNHHVILDKMIQQHLEVMSLVQMIHEQIQFDYKIEDNEFLNIR